MTNRALILGALADGETRIENALASDDTERMVAALRALGFEAETERIVGRGGVIPVRDATIDVGLSGTCARFLTALVALGLGEYKVTAAARMRERPMAPLVKALRELGADVSGESLPLTVDAIGLEGREASIDAGVSSQFISGLLMVGPYAENGLTLRLRGKVISRPYIDMTLQQMARAGVKASWQNDATLVAPRGVYRAGRHVMESDASNASYFFAAAAITGGRARVPRLPRDSIQGDLALLDVLSEMGCRVHRLDDVVEVEGPSRLRGIDVDANAFPDMAQTIAAVAPFADGPTRVTNVASLRVKETDRIAAVATELRKLGQEVEVGPDWFRVTPRPITPAVVETYDDHRMAMAFAIVGLRVPGIRIKDPGCVAKTYPGFFEDLARV